MLEPMPTWGLIAILAVGAVTAWLYNRVIALRQRARAAWSDIDVQLKRRWDLVPALTEAVKGYMAHESGTLERVVQARQRAMAAADAGSVADRGRDEKSLAAAAHGLVAVVEDYPDLKASGQFLELQKSLVEIENTLQHARRYFNAVVRDYNILIATFPTLLLTIVFRFTPLEFFQLEDDDERAVPQVDVGDARETS
jgi:LemA protein